MIKSLKTSFRFLGLVFTADYKMFFLLIATNIAPSVFPFINAYTYKLIIDTLISSFYSGESPVRQLLVLGTVRLFISLLESLNYKLIEFVNYLLSAKFPSYLNSVILSKIANLDISYFEDPDFKNKLEKVRETYNWQPLNLLNNSISVLSGIVQTTIALVAVVNLNFFIIPIILLAAIPEFIAQIKSSKVAYAIWNWQSPLQRRFWYLANILQDASHIKEIKVFKLSKKLINEIKKIHQVFYKDNYIAAKNGFFLRSSSSTIGSLVFFGVEAYIIFQAFLKKITIGDISFYSNAVFSFQSGLGGLIKSLNATYESSLYINSIFEILDTNSKIKSPDNATFLNPTTIKSIEFKNVSFAYKENQKEILSNFSLKIEAGTKVALVGENGVGKSTIIKLLLRLYDATAGEILINGVNIKNISLSNLYDIVGVIFQDFNKYEFSVEDNIAFGNPQLKKDDNLIVQSSAKASADNFIQKLPYKYKQMLGNSFEDGKELSVGQWQKIALARVFYKNSPVLVLDEPTSAIDARAEAEIFNIVNNLSKGKTIIFISHRFSTVRYADIIYVISDGKISESGSHNELMLKDGEYAALFKLQAHGYV